MKEYNNSSIKFKITENSHKLNKEQFAFSLVRYGSKQITSATWGISMLRVQTFYPKTILILPFKMRVLKKKKKISLPLIFI